MTDLDHTFSGDLGVSATGDLLTSDAVTKANQRVLRRLLTNPGDYLWHPDYGAGLPARVGSTLDADELSGLIRTQVLLEDAVAPDPEPDVSLAPIPDGVRAAVRYTLRESGLPAAVRFTVSS